MQRLSFERWSIPAEIAGVLYFEDFETLRGATGLSERHRHAELELHLVLGGPGTYLVGDERLLAEPGTVLWVPPEVDHVLLDAQRGFQRWMILVRATSIRALLGKNVARDLLKRRVANRLCRTLPRPAARALAALYAEVRDQGFESTALHNAGIEFAVARTWVLFSRTVATPHAAELHPAVARAARILRDSDSMPSMDELGRQSGLSVSHLSRLFREEVGLSVTEFRNRRRVERFLELFGDGQGRSLTDAALAAGFGSYPQFYRVFQGIMGCSPANHARRVRAGRIKR
jgi:AraC-like DNA-binding protein